MTTDKSPRFSLNVVSLNQGRDAIVSLALATLIAIVVIVACRAITHVLELGHAELDGIAFLAGIYWILSVIGYFVPRAAKPSRLRIESARYAQPQRPAARLVRPAMVEA